MPTTSFTVDTSGVNAWQDAARQRIFGAVREGLQAGMESLAWTVADKLQGAPITSRSGALLGAILGSPKVTENAALIRGTVSSDVGKKHLGLWLEEGISVRSTKGDGAQLYQFFPADGASVFTHGHAAFSVKGKPFLTPSLEQDAPTILDLIQAKLREALDGAV